MSVRAVRHVWLCRCLGASASPAIPAYLPRVNSGEVPPAPPLLLADPFSSASFSTLLRERRAAPRCVLGWNPGLAQACPRWFTVAACCAPGRGLAPGLLLCPGRRKWPQALSPKPRYSAWRLDGGCRTVLPCHPQ